MHGVLEPILEKMAGPVVEKWDDFLQSAVFVLNARTHTVTGFSPFQMVYGFSPRLPGDVSPTMIFDLADADEQVLFTQQELSRLGLNRAAAFFRLQRQAQQMAMVHQEKCGGQTISYKPGDQVKLKRTPGSKFRAKFTTRWEGPFVIDRVGPHDSFFLRDSAGVVGRHPSTMIFSVLGVLL